MTLLRATIRWLTRLSMVFLCWMTVSIAQASVQHLDDYVTDFERKHNVTRFDLVSAVGEFFVKLPGIANKQFAKSIGEEMGELCERFGGVHYYQYKHPPKEIFFEREELIEHFGISAELVDKYGTEVGKIISLRHEARKPPIKIEFSAHSALEPSAEFRRLQHFMIKHSGNAYVRKGAGKQGYWGDGGLCARFEPGIKRYYFSWTMAFSGEFDTANAESYILFKQGIEIERRLRNQVEYYYEQMEVFDQTMANVEHGAPESGTLPPEPTPDSLSDTALKELVLELQKYFVHYDPQLNEELGNSDYLNRLVDEEYLKLVNLKRIKKSAPPPTRTSRFEMIAGDVAYLRIPAFRQSLLSRLKDFINANAAKPVTAVIIDLRASTGGLTQAIIDMAGLISNQASVVMIIDRGAGQAREQSEIREDHGSRLAGLPTVVLVDAQTAGGSEVFAAYAQDRGIATVLGARTRGIASMDIILTVDTDIVARVRTAYLLRSTGESIHGTGVCPEVGVDDAGVTGGDGEDESDAIDLEDTYLKTALDLLRGASPTGFPLPDCRRTGQ